MEFLFQALDEVDDLLLAARQIWLRRAWIAGEARTMATILLRGRVGARRRLKLRIG